MNSLIQEFLEDEDSNLYMEDAFLLAAHHSPTKHHQRRVSPRKQVAISLRKRASRRKSEGDVLKQRDPDKDVDSSLPAEGKGRRGSRLWSIKSSHALLDLLGESESGEEDEEEDLYIDEDSEGSFEEGDLNENGGMFYMGSCDDLSSADTERYAGQSDDEENVRVDNVEENNLDMKGSNIGDSACIGGDSEQFSNIDVDIVDSENMSSDVIGLIRKNRSMNMRTVFMSDMSDTDSKYSVTPDNNELFLPDDL